MEESKSISDLTDDLLIEILVRVPCKSVFQCKCVSKRWFFLISNPYFACSFRLHCKTNRKLQRKKFPPNLFCLKQVLLIPRRLPEVDFPLTLSFLQTSQEEEVSVVGSSKGLLLCCSTRDNKKIYYVCNPLTKRWAVLPPNPSSQEEKEVRIGFTCTRSYHNPNSEYRYKVVLLTEFLGSKSEIKVETFSSVTGLYIWTEFVVSCPQNIEINMCGRTVIAHEGKLHWFMPFDNKILVYDYYHDEVPEIIDGPEEADPVLDSQCFDMCLGSLWIARLRISVINTQCSLSMWRLCNNTGKWCLERQISLQELTWKYKSRQPSAREKTRLLRDANVLALDPDNADIVYLGLSNHFVSIDLQTKALNFVSKHPFELRRQALRHLLPTWPTPVPALPHDALPRSKREADENEVEDGKVIAVEVEADMPTRRIKRAKMMPAAMRE